MTSRRSVAHRSLACVIEEVVGQALKGRRDYIVLATKAHLPMGQAGKLAAGLVCSKFICRIRLSGRMRTYG